MDKNSVTGLALIAIIMIVWLQFMSPAKKTQQPPQAATTGQTAAASAQNPVSPPPPTANFGVFASSASGTERMTTIENDLFRATLSSKGATLKSLVLKKHLDGNLKPFNLVSNTGKGAISLLFQTKEGKKIDTRDLYFTSVTADTLRSITGNQTYAVSYHLDVAPGQALDITYLFSGQSYKVDYDVKMTGLSGELAGSEYQLQWDGGLVYTEKNREEEATNTLASAYLGGSLVKLDASKENQFYKEEQSGEAKWVAVRDKYFVSALIPRERSTGIYIEGRKSPGNHFENYLVALKMGVPSTGSLVDNHYGIYLGPLDYNIMKSQKAGLEKLLDFGWDWLTRPFAEFIILPVFNWMNTFISNYGIIIIIFAFLIKLVTYPLTMASTKSMKKMTALQPMLKELQDKYKDNPEKMQSELARIYKEAGVNPLGGCLPVLLQMPLLFAMFYVFRSSIQLRQHGFLWARDLSVPDSILDFGFSIPMYGDHIAVFPILMAVTVFIQQKITPTTQTNDQMKVMMYMFPAMMLLFFNNMPAGLGLYYLMFNIFSVAQQFWINKTTTAADVPKISPSPAAAGKSGQKKKGGPKK